MKFTEGEKLNSLKEIPDWAQPIADAAMKDDFIDNFFDDFNESVKANKSALRESEDGIENEMSTIADFESKIEAYEDYIENNFYNEKCDSGEVLSKIYNSIDELKYEFADYEDACDDKARAAEYCERMYSVIDSLTEFAERGED